MNKNEINEFLAREVMGWQPMTAGNGEYWYAYSGDQIARDKWSPCDNIAQAHEAANMLDELDSMHFYKTPEGNWQATVATTSIAIGGNAPTESAALSLAVARAAGYEG